MKKALLAALLLIVGGVAAILVLRKPPAQTSVPMAATPDGAPREASQWFVARTEPPSLWRVFAAGKVERVELVVDSEISEGPEGSTLPRVSPNQMKVALVRQKNVLVRDLETGNEQRVTTEGHGDRCGVVEASISAWSADSARLMVHLGYMPNEEEEGDCSDASAAPGDFVFDLATQKREPLHPPGEVIAWLPDGSFLLTEASQAQPAATRLLRWRIGEAAAPVAFPAGHYGQVRVGRGWHYAVASAAGGIGKDSRIVRWELEKNTLEGVTTPGTWTEYQWPKLSPSEQQVAFVRNGELWTRDHMVIHPPQQLIDYEWVDDHTLVVETPAELMVVGADDRQVMGRVSVVAGERGK
jgi:hypothetical protein